MRNSFKSQSSGNYRFCNQTPAGLLTQVWAAGFGLKSDLNSDCYVDYKDVDVIAGYWLNANCGDSNDCQGADFEPTNGTVDFADFSKFAIQWMLCNDPRGDNCVVDW
jgi:hypothetical protein